MQIRVEHLTKCYGETTALQDINLTVEDGELFFLLGPSGCGKTTLLRSIAGFETPTSGEIFFDGKPVSGIPTNQRNTAMVFQGYALFPHLTVRENVSFGLEMQGVAKDEIAQRVNKVLDELQIREFADRKPNQLSGGQQQRVALARTLVVHPGCMLLDEPLANLDAKLRRDMRLEIRNICKENHLTGIYVTHDRAEALPMADRIAVFRNGRIEQVGTPDEIYRHPASVFVASFIGDTNLTQGTVRNSQDGTLDTPLGVLRSALLPQTSSNGDKMHISIRPEAFRILHEGESGENTLEVTVKNVDYLGELSEHLAIGVDGSELKFYEINPRGAIRNGQRVRLAISPDDVVCMKP